MIDIEGETIITISASRDDSSRNFFETILFKFDAVNLKIQHILRLLWIVILKA